MDFVSQGNALKIYIKGQETRAHVIWYTRVMIRGAHKTVKATIGITIPSTSI
jgi:hypothetical protein